jgi:hypothetical protein
MAEPDLDRKARVVALARSRGLAILDAGMQEVAPTFAVRPGESDGTAADRLLETIVDELKKALG